MSFLLWPLFFGFSVILLTLLVLLLQYQDRTRQRLVGLVRGQAPESEEQESWWRRLRHGIEVELARANIRMTPEEYLAVLGFASVTGFLTAWIVLQHLSPTGRFVGSLLGMSGIGFLAPRIYINFRQQQRRRKLLEQLPDLLVQVHQSLASGAGGSTLVAFEQVSMHLADPMREEVEAMLADARAYSLHEALRRMQERIDHPALRLVLQSLLIQDETGGEAQPVIERALDAIERRREIARTIETVSTEGRWAAYVVAAVPIMFLIMFSLLSPEFMGPLFTTVMGKILLGLSFILYIVGSLWVFRLMDIRRIVGD